MFCPTYDNELVSSVYIPFIDSIKGLFNADGMVSYNKELRSLCFPAFDKYVVFRTGNRCTSQLVSSYPEQRVLHNVAFTLHIFRNWE